MNLSISLHHALLSVVLVMVAGLCPRAQAQEKTPPLPGTLSKWPLRRLHASATASLLPVGGSPSQATEP